MATFDPDAYLQSATMGATEGASASFDPNAYLGIKDQQTEGQAPSLLKEVGRQAGLTGRALVTGLSAPINAVGDFISGGANLALQAAGSEKRIPTATEIQQQALNESYFPSPQNELEKSVQTGASAMAGLMVPGFGAISAAPEGATAAEVLKRGTSTAVSSVVGSVVGEKTAQKAYEITGSPWAALAVGLATGTVTGSLSGKLTDIGLNAAETQLKKAAGTYKNPMTIEDIRDRASKGYKAMDDSNVVVRSDSVKNNLLPALTQELADNNFSPEIVASHDVIKQNLANLDKVLSSPLIKFDKLEKIRSSFSSLSAGTDDQARLAKIVVSNIDSYLANISNKDILAMGGGNAANALKSLGQARTDWRNQARAQVIQDALDKATAMIEGGKANTSDIIRNNLLSITTNKKKMSMFSTREQNVIKAAVQSNDLEQLLSIMARFNPSRSNFGTALASGSAVAAYTNPESPSGWFGLGASALGNLAERGLTAERVKTANKLISEIASGDLSKPRQSNLYQGMFGAVLGTP